MAVARGTNIDDDFAEAMRAIGGKRPTEIDPNCTVGGNADIVFLADNVIAEVKTLMEDPRDQPNYQAGLRSLYEKWAREGKVPPAPVGQNFEINTANLPEDCGHEFTRWTMKPVKRHAEKANRQIKDLKDTFNLPNARGLFVLCNSGVSYFTPHMIFYELHHVLSGQIYRTIDWIIYMTDGLPVKLPELSEPADMICPPHALGRKKMPKEFFNRIVEAWFDHRGVQTIHFQPDHTILFEAKH